MPVGHAPGPQRQTDRRQTVQDSAARRRSTAGWPCASTARARRHARGRHARVQTNQRDDDENEARDGAPLRPASFGSLIRSSRSSFARRIEPEQVPCASLASASTRHRATWRLIARVRTSAASIGRAAPLRVFFFDLGQARHRTCRTRSSPRRAPARPRRCVSPAISVRKPICKLFSDGQQRRRAGQHHLLNSRCSTSTRPGRRSASAYRPSVGTKRMPKSVVWGAAMYLSRI